MSYDSIANRGDYFSAHYLAEVLPKRLKGKDGPYAAWAEREAAERARVKREGGRPNRVTPRQGLRGYRSRYVDERSFFAEYTENRNTGVGRPADDALYTDRLHKLHAELMAGLGFEAAAHGDPPTFDLGAGGSPAVLALREPTIAAVECGWATETDAAMDPEGAGLLLTPVELGGRERITHATKLVSALFAADEHLRYVLLLAGGVVVLADRTVWGEGRYLAVSLDVAFGRNGDDELAMIAALFSAEQLRPPEEGGEDPLAVLGKASRDHAVGVSKDLREGLQRSVEIIANEVLDRLREQGVTPQQVTGSTKAFADDLARQSLRYLYRVLFLLYAEARPDLGVVPAKDEAYVRGYSMARLGDLVVHDLVGEEARTGFHLYESLDVLFRMVDKGHRPRGHVLTEEEAEGLSEGEGLRFEPLKADLFDPERTRLIGRGLQHPDDDLDEPRMPRLDTRLRDTALHKVLRLLMLSRGRRKERGGFISYAQLGINQLGAVYEGLMSYTGFIADEALYEVAKNGNPKDGSWMVPHSKADDFLNEVFVKAKDEDGKATDERVEYRPGAFVYRLAGRDRETSASYYTPESLTRLTVELTLRERLDQDGETTPARELLDWTICEPALGSGAFLNEAINQVAEEYVKRREAELGEHLDPEERLEELQKAKAYIALHNSYGVDLNETAVELAEVSLWLNVMHRGLQAPWFGLHLRRGNSLVGCGRRFYRPEELKKGAWLTSAPLDVPFRDGVRPDGGIHHFLLPAHGWGVVSKEKEAKNLAPEQAKALAKWRTGMRKQPTGGNGKKSQTNRLKALAGRVEYLWELVIRRLQVSEREISRPIEVWGAEGIEHPESVVPREEVLRDLQEKGTPFWRLKTLMDAWCALWFWPVQDVGLLNGSDEEYRRLGKVGELSVPGGEGSLFGGDPVGTPLRDLTDWLDFAEALLGRVDIPEGSLFSELATLAELDDAEQQLPLLMGMEDEVKLGERFPWLHKAEQIAAKQGFFHWELMFAQVFARGGFDIQVGNPPWVRPRWDESAVLAESDPWFKLVEKPSLEVKQQRKASVLGSSSISHRLLDERTGTSGMVAFFSSEQVYPLVTGTQPDVYRCFMIRTWGNAALVGVVGLLHPDTHFSGDNEGALRTAAYRRLRVHGDFVNPGHRFFPEPVGESSHFGMHIYGADGEIGFDHLCWLFSADALRKSFDHDGSGDPPGVRYKGQLDERPHRSRVIRVTPDLLALWQSLTGEDGKPVEQARLLTPVSTAENDAIKALAEYPVRLGQFQPQISSGYHESGAKNEGLIGYNLSAPGDWSEVILKGVQIGVATPLFKSPTAGSNDVLGVNLMTLPEDAVPETEYRRVASTSVFQKAQSRWLDYQRLNRILDNPDEVESARVAISEVLEINKGDVTEAQIRDRLIAKAMRRYTEFYRLAWREMIAPDTERSLYASIIPGSVSHVHSVRSSWVASDEMTVLSAGFWSSVPLDYFLRVTGVGHLDTSNARSLLVGHLEHPLSKSLVLRTARLNCLTNAYSDLWQELYDADWAKESWACEWPGIQPLGEVGSVWEYQIPLRSERARRSALVEIDALVAVWLRMDVDALIAAYRARFPVLNRFEETTWFDANGWKLAGYHRTHGQIQTKESYKQFMNFQEKEGGATPPEGYTAPFYKADREGEYRQAHAYFTERVERAKASGEWDGNP
ncbi:hypothetical protein CLV63_104246 [Murinocardiopsis flavida]|uniref:site-specific DNA-methyltransferase (adenine-specific) n=1 Tax=Murinocardiopsis flavida TaxID=645275 RepID=A0A2P8DP73_9ACTN|nr:restriction endonuclease [Murinocardiopsis flavida]PSK99022.1 hypothetical protein CLV63_104246 [Murinocardiopsis flavida]